MKDTGNFVPNQAVGLAREKAKTEFQVAKRIASSTAWKDGTLTSMNTENRPNFLKIAKQSTNKV